MADIQMDSNSLVGFMHTAARYFERLCDDVSFGIFGVRWKAEKYDCS